MVLKRKFIYLISFILGAMCSPPDIFSQLLLSIPMVILYEFIIYSSILIKIYKKKYSVYRYK